VVQVVEYVGRSGYVGGYQVVVGEDRVRVLKDGVTVADQPVPLIDGRSIGRFAAEAEDLRIGWGRLPTGDEVIVLFDGRQPRLAYTVNLLDPTLSAWGEPLAISSSVSADSTDSTTSSG
jgi:hypothetical protein